MLRLSSPTSGFLKHATFDLTFLLHVFFNQSQRVAVSCAADEAVKR